MTEDSDENLDDLGRSKPDLFDVGLAAAFGGDGPASEGKSVLQILQTRSRSTLDLQLESSEGEGVPVKVTEDAKQLRDPSGRYQVLGEIGRGGVGVVYKGRDQDLGRDVAMKVLKDEYAERPEVLARFVEEAQIGGQLQHPGIVPVYELGLQNGERPYFAMKLVKGETLAIQLSQRADPASDRSRFIGMFEQICQTLAYSHSRHVVHRDLKPANVMIGAFGEVQVVDWGFAKVLTRGDDVEERAKHLREEGRDLSVIETLRSKEDSGSGSASVAGSVMGTPAYMSPEQALGDIDKLDERADVFSLGAILCEILTGSPPYTKEQGNLIEQARYASIEPARARLAACGADEVLVALCLECLTPERDRRPVSGSELAKRIAAHRASIDARARKAEVRAGQWRIGLFASLIGIVAITLGLGLWAKSVSAAERDTRRELARASEIKQLMTEMLSSVSPERASTADLTLLKEILGTASARLEAGAIEDRLVAAELQTVVGKIYNDIGDAANAELHLVGALAIRTDELGADDPATLTTAHQLARVYGNTQRLKESEEILLRTVAGRTRVLGAEDRATLESRIALVRCHFMQGRLEESASEAIEVVSTAKAALETDSPLTLDALFLLGTLQFRLDRLEEAGETLEEVCQAYRRTPGDPSPRAPLAIVKLASLRARNGRSKEAEELGREGLEIADRLFGVHNPRRLGVAREFVRVLFIMGRYADVEALIIQIELDYHGGVSSERQTPPGLTLGLGSCLMSQGKYQEAHELFEALLTSMSESGNSVEQELLTCMSGLTRACQELGLYEQAGAMRRRWQPRQLAAAALPNAQIMSRVQAAISLMAPEDPELNNPERAQALLEGVCAQEEAAGGTNLWVFLKMLARAQLLSGDSAAATGTARRALAAVPDTADEVVRDMLRAEIEEYGE